MIRNLKQWRGEKWEKCASKGEKLYQGLDGENGYLILLEIHMEEIHMDKGMAWTEYDRQMGQSGWNSLGAEKENALDFIGDVYHDKNHKKWQLEGCNYTSSIACTKVLL